MYLPLVTWLTGVSSRALLLPAVHPWRDPCRWVSGDGMRVEPALMHPEGGSWTEVRTHTPSKFSKVRSEPLAPIPLDHSKFRENGSQPSMIPWLPSPHHLQCREAVWQVPAAARSAGARGRATWGPGWSQGASCKVKVLGLTVDIACCSCHPCLGDGSWPRNLLRRRPPCPP